MIANSHNKNPDTESPGDGHVSSGSFRTHGAADESGDAGRRTLSTFFRVQGIGLWLWDQAVGVGI